jgi:hypothetical protein
MLNQPAPCRPGWRIVAVHRSHRHQRLQIAWHLDSNTRPRQSGAQLLFRDDTERERPASDFGDEARAFRTRQAFDIVTGDVERLGGRPPKPLRDVLAGALKPPSA